MASEWPRRKMYVLCYILYSLKSRNFYYGYTGDLKARLKRHQLGGVPSTKPFLPWKLVWYSGFENKKLAKDFEKYLKSGSGKAFAYKRFVNIETFRNSN
jgi:predicted GIY-YIG superfamily endonuclease